MRNWRDWQSLFYLLLLPVKVIWQWNFGFNGWLYFVVLFLSMGVIHHNHTHLRMWRSKRLNRLPIYGFACCRGIRPLCFTPPMLQTITVSGTVSEILLAPTVFHFPVYVAIPIIYSVICCIRFWWSPSFIRCLVNGCGECLSIVAPISTMQCCNT